jgi:excisionase family DNA binding protein
MAHSLALEERQSEKQGLRPTLESTSSLPATCGERTLSDSSHHGIEVLLTTKEASQVLKIHPKVLERMAKRREVPALKVGKFWRYRATALDAWINSRLQSGSQPCRTATSF